MKLRVTILLLVAAALSCQAADFDLGSRGVLSVKVPEKWTVTGRAVNRPDGTPIGFNLAIAPKNEANAKCLLTFAYVTNGSPNKALLQKEGLRICERLVGESLGK